MGDANDATEHDVADETATGADSATAGALMGLLAEHVPLALLADLAAPTGPHSTEILQSEGLPDDAWWETPGDAPNAPDASEPEPGEGGVGDRAVTA
ncbi:MAG TPA: hypothetical protein VIK12_05735 [Pengzhenrongella sp.]